jgi:uncharacterized membrane protein
MNRRGKNGNRENIGFGERYAAGMTMGFIGMALMLVVGESTGGAGAWSIFYALVVVLPMSYWFRRRAMHDQRRRNEAMQDERDAAILAQADRVFRLAASCWFVLLALALSFDGLRAGLPQHRYAIPSLLLLGVIVANAAGHLAAWRLHRCDRLSTA